MKSEDEKPLTGPSKPLPRTELKSLKFNSLLPEGPRNPSPSAAPIAPDLSLNEDQRNIFDVFFIRSKLSFSPSKPLFLKGTIDSTELQNRKKCSYNFNRIPQP